MSGPRMIGIKDVINPYEGLQESVSRVGDIYRNYENDQRNAEKHAREMEVYQRQQDEAKRQEDARNYLKDYKVEVGGADFVGLDEYTRNAVIEAERKALEALGPNATPEQYQALTADLVSRRAKLATSEEVQSRMLNDLVKNGVDPQAAAILSANESSKYQSIDKMQASLAEQAKLDNERADNIAKSIIDYQKALNNGKSNTSVSNGTGVKLGVGESEFDFDTSMMEFLKDRIGSWDAKDAASNIRMAVTEFNAQRALEDPPKPPVSAGSFAAVVANAVTSGQLNNEAIYKSPGEWVYAFNEFADRSGIDNAFSKGYRSLPENLQATLNNYLSGGNKSRILQRSEVAQMRVDEVYKDLLKKKGSGRLDGASGDDTESGRQKETRLQQEAAAFDDYELRELRRLQQEAGTVDEDNSQLGPVRSSGPVGGRLPSPKSAPKSKENSTSGETDRLNKIEAEIVAINSDPARKAVSGNHLQELEREKGWILDGEWTARNNLEKTARELDQVTNELRQRNKWPLKNAKVLADIEELQQEQTRLTGLLRTQREEARRLTSAGVRASNSPVDVNLELDTLLTQPSGSGRLQNVTPSPSIPASQDNTVVEESPAVAASPELEKARVAATVAALSDPGASIPKELTEARFPAQVMYQINRFTPEQINSLDANIGKELTTYDALANYARLSGNTKRLAEIGQEVGKLNRLRSMIDPRVTEKSTSTSTRIPLTGGTAAEAVEDLSSLADVPNEAGRITTPVDSLLNVTDMTNEQAAETYDYISGRIPYISQALMNARANGDIRTQLSLERELLALERTKLQIESKLGNNSIGTRLPSR